MSEVNIPKILIYGASSQVGASVALFLSQKKIAHCTCLLRNANSSVFFEINQIPFHITATLSEEDLKLIIQSHHVILDFTYPSGQANIILKTIKENMQSIISQMSCHQKYFHMSSIMAFGFPDGEKNLKYYKIPRTSYGYIKRNAELIARTLGAKYKVPIYNFRLGQVHGFLQSVNTSYRNKLFSNTNIYLDGEAHDKVNVIFINSLCYAIVDCLENKYQPNVYTLVNDPQWTLEELYKYYVNVYGFNPNIVYEPKQKEKKQGIKLFLLNLAKKYRPLLETYVLFKFPLLYKKVKGKFRQASFSDVKNQFEYTDFHILGKPSTAMIKTKFSSLKEVSSSEEEMETLYVNAIENHSNG